MTYIQNIPRDIIGNIIDYTHGPTSTILDRHIMVNDIRLHFKRLEHYPKSIGKDNYYNIFEVIDSMHALYEKNVCLLHVNQILN